jgi:protein ImuB
MLKQGAYQAKAQLQLFDGVNNSAVENECVANSAGVSAPHFPMRRAVRPDSLWLCIRFPELPLEALGSPRDFPAAVLSEKSGVTAVLACNDKATKAGIAPGMSLNAALALVPALDIRQSRESAEIAMLQARANWALAYTPVVSIDPAGALLLELGGSLRLFGGLSNLRGRLLADLHTCGHRVIVASAPVAKAALWLARAGKQLDCNKQHQMPGLLADLPLGCLAWPVAVQRQLMQMGVRTLGDCVRLPRGGFARRVGPGYLHELDQGFGRSPNLLAYYQPPEDFHASLELMPASLIAEEIAGALHELCSRLSVFLRQRQVNVQRLHIKMEHCSRDPTLLEIVLREPCTSANYFLELLQLQLDKHMLPAPVTEVSLQASATSVADSYIQAGAAQSTGSLLADASGGERNTDHTDVNRLIERLQARLGIQHVYGLNLVAEHRPERAWAVAEASGTTSSQIVPGQMVSRIRPLWLFASPRRMATRCGKPLYRGRLAFVSDVERIESGWWDGHDIRRDYYTVTSGCGRRLWVYWDCRDSGWYLHGLFG